jgi:hypothetical protein
MMMMTSYFVCFFLFGRLLMAFASTPKESATSNFHPHQPKIIKYRAVYSAVKKVFFF